MEREERTGKAFDSVYGTAIKSINLKDKCLTIKLLNRYHVQRRDTCNVGRTSVTAIETHTDTLIRSAVVTNCVTSLCMCLLRNLIEHNIKIGGELQCLCDKSLSGNLISGLKLFVALLITHSFQWNSQTHDSFTNECQNCHHCVVIAITDRIINKIVQTNERFLSL